MRLGPRAPAFRDRATLAEWCAFVALISLAAALYVTHLDRQGYGNEYYAAAAKSMTMGWRQFFFASFDPTGFISVDKPPVALWVQAASVRAFGLSSWSVLLPSALAGVASVAVLYAMVRARFGPLAGLLAGLALTFTPITAATVRDNNPDAILVLLLLLAAAAAQRAAAAGSLRWMIVTAVLVGIAFNTKMLQAFLVLPAFGLAYFVSAPVSLPRRAAHLAAAAVIVAVVSVSWLATVDSVPASSRPYVGGTVDNRELSLAFGHNGLDRFDTTSTSRPSAAAASSGLGPAGWKRFFSSALAPQVSWLLPLAGVGAVFGWLSRRGKPRDDTQRAAVMLWGGWALTHLVVFSVVGGHRYYTAALAPADAALAGIGLALLIGAARATGTHRLILPAAVVCTAGLAVFILLDGPHWNRWLIAAVPTLAAASVLALSVSWPNRSPSTAHVWATGACALAVAAVFLAPAVWAASPMATAKGASGGDPHAGPAPVGGPRTPAQKVEPLVRFLSAHRGGSKYLVATLGVSYAAPMILATAQPVMAIGGWSGGDPTPTTDQLAGFIADGSVRFVFLAGARSPKDHHYVPEWTRQHDSRFVIPGFVRSQCKPVNGWTAGGEPTLYDCKR